jgi:hypothetical protein
MKATRSKDGELRFSVLIRFRISRSDLWDWVAQNALILESGKVVTDQCGGALTRSCVLDGVRENLGRRAQVSFSDDVTDEEWRAADAEIDRLFPELKRAEAISEAEAEGAS